MSNSSPSRTFGATMTTAETTTPLKDNESKEMKSSFLSPPKPSINLFPSLENVASSSSPPPSENDNDEEEQELTETERTRKLLAKEANYDICHPTASKRQNYLPWDDFFMAVAFLSAKRSKDPNTQVGACIVKPQNKTIVGIGYNGFPRGCSDDYLPWANEADCRLHTKDFYMCHAEVNAILNKCSADVFGARMYVAHFPCNECAKIIIQSGIREIVYLHDRDHNSDSCRASRILFELSGVTVRQLIPIQRRIVLDFGPFHQSPSTTDQTIDTNNNSTETQNFQKIKDLLLNEANYDITNSILPKRQNYLSWDDYFMAMAFLSAQRSKDPNTQVGACIVDGDNRIVGIGYNGFPRGCSDDYLPWARKGKSNLHTKYLYVCHAEVNAILNKCSADVVGARIYVALFPCNDCAKMIIQAGIREVIYLSDIYHDTDSCRASRILFELSGVKTRQFQPGHTSITIDFQTNF